MHSVRLLFRNKISLVVTGFALYDRIFYFKKSMLILLLSKYSLAAASS